MKLQNIDTDTIIKKRALTLDGNENVKSKVFDWHKAVRIIKKNHYPLVSAGLAEDWDSTSGIILEDNIPVFDTYTYLASFWATPVLVVGAADEGIECWCWEDECDWTAGTLWPASAYILWRGNF